jgi:hypothetical protein
MFPIKATVTIGTHAELERFTAFIAANTDANVKSAPKLETAKDAAVPAGKPKADPAQTAPSKPTAGKTDAPAASTAKPEPQPSTEKAATANSAPARADVSKAAVALALKDKAQIVAILAKFDAKGVKDVPDDKLAEVFPLINAALEALGG